MNNKNKLIDAIHDHDLEKTKELLSAGADPNVRFIIDYSDNRIFLGREGATALHVAADRAAAAVDMLLEAGADPWLKDDYGRTPLHIAADVGNIKSVRSLCEWDRLLSNEKNDVDQTPLHIAAVQDEADVCVVLIEAGADLTARDSYDKLAEDLTSKPKIKAMLLSAREAAELAKVAGEGKTEGAGRRRI